MGFGDSLMALGDAQALHEADRTLRIAIGNPETEQVAWSPLYEGVPFLLRQHELHPGRATAWVKSYPSCRPYIDYQAMEDYWRGSGYEGQIKQRKLSSAIGHYVWRKDYRAKPATAFKFTQRELDLIDHLKRAPPYIVVEPNIKRRAPRNKAWSAARMEKVVQTLNPHVFVKQVSSPEHPHTLLGANRVTPASFREAMCHVAAAKLYIGPEGGLHHAAAAVGTRAVVLFGGYISPETTGYDAHVNLTGGAEYACGTKTHVCDHCREAMSNITAEDVIRAAKKQLDMVGVGVF